MIRAPYLLITLLFWLLHFSANAQFSQIRFEKLDIRDGLSHNRVNSIYQDQLGYMWFATRLGLNRYDGHSIRVIEVDLGDPYSPKVSDIVWMREGPRGHLWMKTYYGIYAYDIFKEQFTDIVPLLEEFQIGYKLDDIVKDTLGNYWFLIPEVGVKKFISSSEEVQHFGGAYRDVVCIQPDQNGNMALVHRDGEIELMSISDNRKNEIIRYPDHLINTPGLTAFIDDDGDYWFYSLNSPSGITFYNPINKDFRKLSKQTLGSDLVTGILQDESKQIIIGLDHGGLSLIDKDSWSIRNFKNSPSDPNSLSHNSIISLYKDHAGLIWIGTHKGGVDYFSQKSVVFNFYKQSDQAIPAANDIWPLVEGEQGTIWMGTDGGGLVHFDPKSGHYTNYLTDLNNPNSISSNIVVSMARAADGGLWIGTYFGGLNYFDGKNFHSFRPNPDDPNALSDHSVWVLFIDSHKHLWVGTVKGGIDVYDTNFTKIHHFDDRNGKIHSNYITSICEDKDGLIWIGTGYGIEVFNPITGSFKHIIKEEENPNSLNSNSVLHIYCDHTNNLWIGSMYGLNRYLKKEKRFESFTKEDGLPENLISSIVEDDLGNMWFSGYKSLSKLTFEKGEPEFENFDTSDGLQGDMFNERSSIRLSNGDIAFGGKNGLNVFDPEEISLASKQNKIVFTDFFISNHQIKPGQVFNDRPLFEAGFNSTSEVVLKPSENSFSVGFTALSFYNQENLLYKYRLSGFDDDWTIRSNRQASFTNLDAGVYRFEVMVSDQNQQWYDNPISLNIRILTPWWKTPIAYGLYIILVVASIIISQRIILQRSRFRARLDQERLESKRIHELDLMKIKFITNVSHEFRTPLTLILTPVERLLKLVDDPMLKKNHEIIFRNAKRLLTLVNQLLDFRKMEANQHRLSLSVGDLVAFLRDTTASFTDLAADRQIRLNFASEIESFLTRFDHDKIEKILFNLLSNAFKFTYSGGNIWVEVEEVAHADSIHTIRIRVVDTGIGIPDERKQDVFNRFFQLENATNPSLNHGSGIGLSISREFVEMHDGRIWVESKLDEGSSFIFELPLPRLSQAADGEDIPTESIDISPDQHLDSRPTLLLVEDDSDFRFYLRDNLKEHFNVYENAQGMDAWKRIIRNPPDIVVTDIMMPGLSGTELCKKIKSNPRVSHIPVILLTAHYSDDQKLAGYEAGAIEYITKPFNFDILVHAINSALQLQRQMQGYEKLEIKPSEIEITSRDEHFIQNAIDVVERNISNTEYSVQEMSRDLAVSRGQLYKKILELTGLSPIEFIRSIRLQRAAALLEKSQLSVSEIAYQVGFNSPKYFTKYFKKQFKVIPSQYPKK